MRTSLRLIVALFSFLVCSIFPSAAIAQVKTGTPAFGSFSGSPDVINNANLNAHLSVPVVNRAGRGTNFDYDVTYDSSVWNPATSGSSTYWQPVGNWGWSSNSAFGTGLTGYVTFGTTTTYCYDGQGHINGSDVWVGNSFYADPWASGHSFSGYQETKSGGCGASYVTTYPSLAKDGSGLTINGPGGAIITKDGTALSPPVNPTGGSYTASVSDRNGNLINTDASGNFFDTLSSTVKVLSVAGTAPSPVTFSYTPPTGANVQYKMNFTNYTVATNFAVSNISEYKSSAAVPLVTSIVLPDNSQYTFLYEATPALPASGACTPYSGTTCVTARIAKITLPTGGYITYTYTGGSGSNGSGIFSDGSAATLSRTVSPGGTWTYAQAKGSGAASTTTVTDPQSNVTTIQFQGIYETKRQIAGMPTTDTCYNGGASPCTSTAIVPPIASRTVISTTSDNWVSKHYDSYDSYGVITQSDDYDFGAGAAGSLIRRIVITYASLGNINAFQQLTTICNGTGTASACNGTGSVISQTTNGYDETSLAVSSGTPQHVAVSGSRGNLTSTTSLAGLTSHFTYFDTGTVQTATDVNGATTTYNYPDFTSTCGNAFPTSLTEPLTLSRSFLWNCNWGVLNISKDENLNSTYVNYTDAQFWRPSSTVDPTSAQTNFTYTGQTSIESALTFNASNSTSDTVTTLDGLGRPHVQQTRQAPGSSNFDSIETDYDTVGRVSRVTVPYVGSQGATNSSAPATTTTYDALNRPLVVTDGAGGTVSYSYGGKSYVVTVGPAPTGELTKRRQLELDVLGRITSVCEISSVTGSGTCNQSPSQTGFWTKYVYNALGDLISVTQNAQATSGQQTRSYSYDGIGRLTSESNPESGTSTYVYDVNGGCGASAGDLTKKTDANGINTCFGYDALHRVVSTQFSNSTSCKFFRYDTDPGIGWTEGNIKGRLSYSEIANCSTGSPTGSQDGFNYSARGELINTYHTTVSSGVWYNSAASYWANGARDTLQLFTCVTSCTNTTNNAAVTPLITYHADGEGRPSTVFASSGQNPVTATTYNAASLPTAVTYGSTDTDALTYDPNTFRMTKYQFNVSGQAYIGALTWNPNGSLGSQVITDPFNSADAQTCSYSHDDLSRIAKVDCGATKWQQNFTYDAFGNITKTVPVGGTGNSFQPTYSATTNRFTSLPGFTPTYDADGNVTADGSHTYSWDANGNSTIVDGVGLTFDASDRMVEQNRSGTLTEVIYAPTGQKFALMNGTTLKKAFIALPGNVTAIYTSAGLDHYWHTDWLGSARLAASPTRTVLSTVAYAPFGETYASSGTPDPSFTGQNPDTTSGDYDFLYREYSNQGRWSSPDPGGLAVADLSNPQSWNRYGYVLNNPGRFVDWFGLGPCPPGADDCVTVTALLPAGIDQVYYDFGGQGLTSTDSSGGGNGGKTTCGAAKPKKTTLIISVNATTNIPTIKLGAEIGGAIGGPAGAVIGGAVGSFFGVGGTASYVPSTNSWYVGGTTVVGLGGGTGVGANAVFVPPGQNPNSIANGKSYSLTMQPLPPLGSTVVKSPGSGPPVAGPSVGTRIPVSAGFSYNVCVKNCGC